MRKLFNILFIIFLLSGTLLFAADKMKVETPKIDLDANAGSHPYGGATDDLFDAQFAWLIEDGGSEAGIETDGNYVYTTKYDGPVFRRYAMNGAFIEEFSITGCPGSIRDLAYDGQYFYGSATSTTVYQMDFDNETLISTITAPITVRGIAYDAMNDGFWANNWSDQITLFDRNGNTLDSFACGTYGSFYGFAWENILNGGPYLWGYAQDGPGNNQLVQFDIATGMETGVTFDVASYFTFGLGPAGGLLISDAFIEGKVTICGLSQSAYIWGLEFADYSVPFNSPGLPTDVVVTAAVGGVLEAAIEWTCPDIQAGGDPLNDLDEMRVYRDEELIYTDFSPLIGGAGSYTDTGVPGADNYAYKIVGVNSNGEGIPAIIYAWVGEDVPGAVTDLILTDISGDELIAQLDWTNPTAGYHGGYYTGLIGYNIERSDGETFNITGSTTTWQDDSIVDPGLYIYTVTPYNASGSGPSTNSLQVGIGYSVTQVGVGEVGNYHIPMDLYMMDSMVEVIYLQEWLDAFMVISAVSFHANTVSTMADACNFEVWLGETAEDDLSAGWIDGTNMIQVFDGTLNIPPGDNWVAIELDENFVYENNGNLVMMIIRDDDQYYSPSDLWWCTDSGTPFRTRFNYNDNPGAQHFDAITGPFGGWDHTIYPDVRFYYSSDASAQAPGASTDVTFTADAGGALETEINWICPTMNSGGNTLTELLEMRVYRDDELIYTDTNPIIGDPGTHLDISVPFSGNYEYSVVGYNSFGIGIPVEGMIWVGEDVPNVVENLLLTGQAGAGYLTWDNPITGLHGGPFNEPIAGYHLERSDGEIIEISGVVTEYIDDTIPVGDYYSYTVTPYNSVGDGPPVTSNSAMLGAGDEIFFDDFESGLVNWNSIINSGNGEWLIYTPPFPNSYNMPSSSSGNILAADTDLGGPNANIDCTINLITPLDLTVYTTVELRFDNDFNALNSSDYCYVDVTNDGGVTWNNVLTFSGVDVTATNEIVDITEYAAGEVNVNIRFHSVQPGWHWWWAIDNVGIYGIGEVILTPPSNVQIDEYLGLLTWEEPTISRAERQTQKNSNRELLGYNVYLDGELEGNTSDLEWQYTDLVNGEEYVAGVQAVYDEGTSDIVELDFTYAGVDAGIILPLITELRGNYPNPFNPITTISFSLVEAGNVSINIYNMRGQLVKTLVNAELENAYHEVSWNGKDNNGKNTASGVYFYTMRTQNYNSTKKMILMK